MFAKRLLKTYSYLFILPIFLVLEACQVEMPAKVEVAYQDLDEEIDFNFHVKPILSDKCYFCHGPDLTNNKGGLRLDTFEGATKTNAASGLTAIDPAHIGNSSMIARILSEDEDVIMPPVDSNLKLTDEEKAILIKWIEQGAKYEDHWAFQKPDKKEAKPTSFEAQKVNKIDDFVFSKLEKNGLAPQAEADKETLLRRVSLDLTGLPPTVEEIDAFLADKSESAYEKAVDRLLASPHYGEKMASSWMDLSRFADTHGYSVDRYRPMWPWRDWVIEAFNKNMGYDQFVTWQLAGDLLPNPTKEQRIASAFNRNHAQNMEGGIVNEEFRVEYVADRTNTFGKAFLALSLECARCHDHKYDAISQKEYFQISSFFNQIDESGQISWDDAMPVPTMLLTDNKQDSLIDFLAKQIKETEQRALAVKADEGQINIKKQLNKGLRAYYTFETTHKDQFQNQLNKKELAKQGEPQAWKKDIYKPELVEGKKGKAFKSNGDEPLDFGKVGIYNRAEPFSINLWVKVPKDLEDGVFFHKGAGAILYNFRGYHLSLRGNKLEAMLAHTAPYNNIVKVSEKEIPKDEWINLAFVYEGNSKANGVHVYMNGEELAMKVERDNLYKDILFPNMKKEPGLRVGARWRGTGTKNAVYDELRVYDRALTSGEVKVLNNENYSLSEQELALIKKINSPAYQKEQQELVKLRKKQNEFIEAIPELMVMDELAEKRKTYLLERGAYDAHGEEVSEGTISAILPFSEEYPQNRLGLAQWLFSKENPIASKVVVNRIWQSFFGNGLVKSVADFGNQGELPSHPKLLNWLSVDLMENGWDLKRLNKQIVMSASYRQSSSTSAELKEKDYDNTLISRGPSARLTAEQLRDNALAASGLLNKQIGGASVKPYQPKGLWRVGGKTYKQDKGEKLYRRSLYTFWKRTVPPPSMNTFDAPTRSYCVVKRQETNTPLQSLTMLNDPQFVEATRVLAGKAYEAKDTAKQQIELMYLSLTAKHPKADELALLQDFYNKQLTSFKKNPKTSNGWLNAGESEKVKQHKDEVAALSVTASIILNSDAALMKR